MSIRALREIRDCPKCNSEYIAHLNFGGQSATCPNCGFSCTPAEAIEYVKKEMLNAFGKILKDKFDI